MAAVTVIIPNYNGLKFLGPCMEEIGRASWRERVCTDV